MPDYDVAIIGGGPGGSTTAAFLKKYNPALKIGIFEREKFPRDHIGESQLPPIITILRELGLWEEVERAGFPVKIGATYTWGKTTEPWVFGFLPESEIPEETERPGRYEGWRKATAFQVDRSIYDDILLKHARRVGCDVREQTRVAEVHRDGDRVTALELEGGERITARYYVDASGNAAVLRKAMGVKVEVPTALKNIAFWDYWTNPDWAGDENAKATRIHIRSLPYGWMWHIRIGPTRASVGLVCNAEWYKQCGQRPTELYMNSIKSHPFVARMLGGAIVRGKTEATNDWSYVVERTWGENWFLVGEVAGFADPILSAGLTITQAGGRELAYTILELDRAEHDRSWLLERYDELQKRRVRQHMRFAEFWYSANGMFLAVRENCTKIAKDAGLRLNAEDAFRWISFGGLTDDVPGQAGIGGLDLSGVRQVMSRFTGGKIAWHVSGKNQFKLNLAGATESTVGIPIDGRIHRAPCWTRGENKLVAVGAVGALVEALKRHKDLADILTSLDLRVVPGNHTVEDRRLISTIQALEVLAQEFWVTCSTRKDRPALQVTTPEEGTFIYTDQAGTYA